MRSRLAQYGLSMPLLSAWDSSWVSSRNTSYLIGGLLTCYHDDEVLFIKAYSLKRTTIRGGAHAKPDQEVATGDTTAGAGTGTDAWADASDEKSDGDEQSLQGGPGEQGYGAIDVIEE